LPVNNDPVKEDEFVLTPYGPGKIKSSRIERNAIDNDDHSFGSIFRPTIIYTIDLHFGICHVPANQVTPIAGTSFTEKTVLTYQRAPLTEHDILRLRPMTYLNDSIVNFYLKIMKDQYDQYNNVRPLTNRGWDDLDGEGIHIFPSFCYTRIKNTIGSDTRNSKAMRTKIWNDLSSWTRGTDIFKKKFLIFPINYDLHWSCVFVCHPGRLVRRYANELQRNNVQIDISSEESNEYHGVRNPLTQWQCDFCKIARFDTFNEASEHEKVCEENVDRCMIHFDSGKHFKLHNTSLITSVIRNYLSAVAEYASTHRPLSFTTKNMPGFAASVPQQDNTKDCGVYTLENVERMLQGTHTIDFDFVKSKGTNNLFGEGTLIPGYDKHDIEQKRENILSLIQDLRRGHNNIVR
jgi:Ulp1 family protease